MDNKVKQSLWGNVRYEKLRNDKQHDLYQPLIFVLQKYLNIKNILFQFAFIVGKIIFVIKMMLVGPFHV